MIHQNKTVHNLKKYLQQFPHFTNSAYELALPYLKKQNLVKGEFLLEEGKICQQIAFIEKGLFRTFYLRDGLEITTCFCKENTITCSYKSLITQQPSDLSIQALENCELTVFNYTDLNTLYSKHPFWQSVGRMAAENEFLIMENYTRFINDLPAQNRYLQILEKDSSLLQRVPLVYLASYLQIKPETLSRIRKKLTTS